MEPEDPETQDLVLDREDGLSSAPEEQEPEERPPLDPHRRFAREELESSPNPFTSWRTTGKCARVAWWHPSRPGTSVTARPLKPWNRQLLEEPVPLPALLGSPVRARRRR